MPEAQAVASEVSVSMQRLLSQLNRTDVDDSETLLVPLDDEIVLTQPGRIRMPWGSLALERFFDASVGSIVDLDIDC